MRCSATTKSGAQCKKKAVGTEGLCRTHQGQTKRSTLTEEVAARIVAAVEEGIPPEVAARAFKVPASTFYDWLKEGRRASDDDAKTFAERVDEARGVGEMALLRNVIKAGEKDWRATWRALEALNPDAYVISRAAPNKPDAEVPDGGATDQAGL